MPHELPKAYDPTAIEDHWAEYWVRENLFATPTPKDSGESANAFTILLPPPNVTGRLHMGHMLNQTEMDILTRWHRMKGEPTLWVPGTDHAGIATQMMVEKQVTAEGTTRQALGREAFLERVWAWKSLYGGAILDQMKRLGASVDWQREYFTMDANLSTAVREAFTRLYHEGLIYKGAYIVNWCPGCQTAISDLEVVHEETAGKLWEIRYPVANPDGSPSTDFLTIATTRPETMLGDVAVAIHPEDERYHHLHGKRLILPLTNRLIPVVLDPWVSSDFGTGAVKITPAHDPNDFALAQRHHLPSINIMDDRAKIALSGSKYDGLDRYEARKRIVEDLAEEGLLGAIHEHKLSLGRCDRSKDVVEPRLSEQWFVAVNKVPEGRQDSMAGLAIKAVQKNGDRAPIQFTPSMYEKTYLNWMENIHDWCISRQLWWGHRIPAWHCAACRQITVPQPGQQADPTTCIHCGKQELHQETDVLDTWFSSGLLPVSVFGWPFADNKPSADFNTFYPTSLLVTGFDILFFWVARMIMLGCWFAQDVPLPDGSPRPLAEAVPFRDVYIHALVRDANREKMSKTRGNVIDPIEIVKQYGTDAVRFTLASMASPGTDIAFNVARTEGYRAFANKIWNAARFIFMNEDRLTEAGLARFSEIYAQINTFLQGSEASNLLEKTPEGQREHIAQILAQSRSGKGIFNLPMVQETAPIEQRWIVAMLRKTATDVNAALENYRFDEAANIIYQFFWGSFCDWYLEISKLRMDLPAGKRIEHYYREDLSESEQQEYKKFQESGDSFRNTIAVFETSLRLLSPFMPFITEEIWQAIYDGKPPVKSIALALYPQQRPTASEEQPPIFSEMSLLQNVIVQVRALRKEIGVEEKTSVPIELTLAPTLRNVIQDNLDIIEKLARVSGVQLVEAISSGLAKHSTPDFDVAVIYEREIDIPAERERLTKEIAKLEKNLASAERQLGNESFLSKAPANIVEGLKKQQSENRQLLEKAQAALSALG
jgi:valyl-tRNA synthetase